MHRAVSSRLKTADGSVYTVKHPDFFSVSEGDDGIVVVHTDPGLAILDLANVTAIELIHRNTPVE